ncbi:metal-dependent transcriptional regulator [Kribbia dieselivorans]|uniref:metal-dependent transcriptional regulator n=1 Tax=Kribbia dieselivorans TaxID=331526 RepID=UPI001FDEFC51
MYLRTVFELEEEGVVPMRARIAERLGHSGPTVSQTIARMERDGLIVVTRDRHLEMTDTGRELATRVMRKHRLAERLLSDVIGLDWELVHDEACRWEHVMSDEVERRIVTLLEGQRESPYGNPIPGLGALGLDESGSEDFRSGLLVITDLAEPADVVVRRLSEPVQVDPTSLAMLRELGVQPGRRLRVDPTGGGWAVRPLESDGASRDLPEELAEHVFVGRL